MRLLSLALFCIIYFISISQINENELINSGKSIHQLELEYYNSTGNTSSEYYEAIPNESKVKFEKGGCSLNKIVYGWHPYWGGTAYTNYQWDLLSHFSFFSYEVNSADGQALTTHGWSTSAAVNAALASGNTKVTLCVTLFSDHATFFASPTAQQTLINNLINLIQTRGAHGVNIDFEGLPSTQSTAFCNFMVNLANQMHAAIPGSEVSTVLYAVDWNNVFNFNIMEPAVDHYIIMGYDYYYSGSTTAGPNDPLYHFGSTYNYTLSRTITTFLSKGAPMDKLVLGLPYYGWDYPTTNTTIPSSTTGTGSSRTYTTIRNNTSGYYSAGNEQWISDAVTNGYVYNNAGAHQVFVAMDSAFNKRLDHVLKTGIAGIGIWALGYDNGYTERWESLSNYLTDCYSTPCSGSIHDFGGPVKDYYNNENYTWTISPENAVSLDFDFSLFNVEANWDYLYIYDGPTTSSPQIPGSPFTGTNSPGSFTSSTGSVTFKFTSDVSTVGPGFIASYTCNTLPPPTASFSISSPLTICIGDSIQLVSTSDYASDLIWSTNEGVLTNTSGNETYLHPNSSGNYDVSLQATNATGSNTSNQTLTILVENPPIANATPSALDFTLPNATIFFTNNSTGSNSYVWNFGDGSSSADINPWHTYTSEGTYYCELIAQGNSCPADTMIWTVNVGVNSLIDINDISIQLYPNPTKDHLWVKSSHILNKIEIIDVLGRAVIQVNGDIISPNISVESLSSGMYLLKWSLGSFEGCIPFIKE